MNALVDQQHNFIYMPEEEDMEEMANSFSKFSFPNTIGAIDGTNIDVTVPAEHKNDYYTRKYSTAVNLTAICDSNKMFRAIISGFSARCHDSHILQCSQLGNDIYVKGIIPKEYHLLGDAAYGLSNNIMVPFSGEVSGAEELYNKRHSSTRMVIERAFGDLKGRWRRLHSLEAELSYAKKIIAACCVLHNLSIKYGDIQPTPATETNAGRIRLTYTHAHQKRDLITRHIAYINTQ